MYEAAFRARVFDYVLSLVHRCVPELDRDAATLTPRRALALFSQGGANVLVRASDARSSSHCRRVALEHTLPAHVRNALDDLFDPLHADATPLALVESVRGIELESQSTNALYISCAPRAARAVYDATGRVPVDTHACTLVPTAAATERPRLPYAQRVDAPSDIAMTIVSVTRVAELFGVEPPSCARRRGACLVRTLFGQTIEVSELTPLTRAALLGALGVANARRAHTVHFELDIDSLLAYIDDARA